MIKKIYALVFFFSIFIALGLFKTTPVSADVLAPGEKNLDQIVKFEGWDTVKDYIVVQPYDGDYGGLDICRGKAKSVLFYLVDDSDQGCAFGFRYHYHCDGYYYPFAIDKKYVSDIRALNDSLYTISCTSSAFLNSFITDTILPHETTIDESILINRKDYIVTFQGVDKQSKKLLMSVSEPILRYDLNSPEAKAFKASITKSNTLSNIPPLEEKPLPKQEAPTTSLPTIRVEEPLNNSLNTTWKVISYISLAIFIFVLGLLIGKRKSLAKVNDNVKLPDSN